ncbi:MAG: HPr(Ser) kinase/phosphatase, partial [Clostridium sp.]|nr:HPr(Ser) kinase/phosphatase [Clostridium sp.]
MADVTIKELIEKHGLRNLTPEIDTDNIVLKSQEVNRPALQLAGFFKHFDKDRVQIIGNVESSYVAALDEKRRHDVFEKLISSGIPCLVYSRGIDPGEDVQNLCVQYEVPCLQSDKMTSDLMAEVIVWLNQLLAPMISIHGVLVDVAGVGVLIMGESGIGKSEAALEL